MKSAAVAKRVCQDAKRDAQDTYDAEAPPMAAGAADRLWSMEDIAERIEASRPAPAKRGPYKKRQVG